MNPREILNQLPGESRVLGRCDQYGGEAYLVDADGRKWHVALRALPAHVDTGTNWDHDRGKPRREVVDL